ncbi:unnamed protein product [Paramecium sonneborni]|uniref:Uncharacterized protein n=1 Tax=Paramecium sonneborni TaxID=65129 RepID=A0A8S1RR95_9CILI|nr:unnamed protein product [Paramecium sonneborni]
MWMGCININNRAIKIGFQMDYNLKDKGLTIRFFTFQSYRIEQMHNYEMNNTNKQFKRQKIFKGGGKDQILFPQQHIKSKMPACKQERQEKFLLRNCSNYQKKMKKNWNQECQNIFLQEEQLNEILNGVYPKNKENIPEIQEPLLLSFIKDLDQKNNEAIKNLSKNNSLNGDIENEKNTLIQNS